MSFDWNDFLVLAKELSRDNDESKLRTAISRAYYSAYHYSDTFCGWYGITIPLKVIRKGREETSLHIRVIETLKKYTKAGNYTTSYVNNAGRLLDTLRVKRKHADYEDQPFNIDTNQEASAAVIKTEKIKDLLANKFKDTT